MFNLIPLQKNKGHDREKKTRQDSFEYETDHVSVNTENFSRDQRGDKVALEKRVTPSTCGGGGHGGDDRRRAESPTYPPHRTSNDYPTNLVQKVLMSSQKRDWVTCESSLRTLEKEAQEGGASMPLKGVSHNVSLT